MEEFKLLLDLNRVLKDSLADKIIKEMVLCRESLSGDDSGLKNLWEEVCVQVQGEESFFWDTYQDTIDVYVQAELNNQLMPVKRLLSYIERIEEEDEKEALVYFEPAAIKAIRDTILEKAENYQNENISAHLDEDFEETEDDESEYEKEN